jgi:hypothetical protein
MAAISFHIAAPSVASAHRSLPEKAGTVDESWHGASGRCSHQTALIPDDRTDVTGLQVAWSEGDRAALEQLMPVVHDELRRLARRYMAGAPPSRQPPWPTRCITSSLK